MKALVWFLTYFLIAAIQTALRMGGVYLGAIPTVILYGGAIAVARAICKGLDDDGKDGQKKIEDVPPEVRERFGDDVAVLAPPPVLEKCSELKGDREKLKKYLEGCVSYNLVREEHIPYLLEKLAVPDETRQPIPVDPEQKTVRVTVDTIPPTVPVTRQTPVPVEEKCNFTMEQQRQWLKLLNAVIPTLRLGGTGACVDQALEPQNVAKLGGMRPAVTRVAWSIARMLSITNLHNAVHCPDPRMIAKACAILKEYGELLEGQDKETIRKSIRQLNAMLVQPRGGE